jgi:3D (Asp-Asp-Asp) domain-containing protein
VSSVSAPARRSSGLQARLQQHSRRSAPARGDAATAVAPRYGSVGTPVSIKGIHFVRSLLSAVYVLGAAALLWVFTAPPAFADADDLQVGQPAIVTGTEGRGVKLRAGPGMAHGIISTIAEGTSVQVAAGPVSDGDEDWYQISVGPSKTGWSSGRYLASGSTVKAMTTDDGKRTFLAKVTAYADGIGGVPMGARTYSGTKTRWGVVAVDPKSIPIGSALTIEGYDDTIFVAEDVGGGIKGDALDIWLPAAKDARTYGTKYRRVTVVREGPAR